jgi:cholesterol oxidase
MANVSRRGFLKSSAAFLGTSAITWAQRSEPVEALVIGSGFGGSIAALRLAQAGVRVVVLERGRRWAIRDDGDTFATFENPDGRAAWLSNVTTAIDNPPKPIDRYTGVLELINANGMDVRTGVGVGGSSLAYNAILLQPRRELFDQIFSSTPITYDEMNETFYPRVRGIIRPSTIPQDVLNSRYYQSTRVNMAQAAAAGFETRPVEYGIDFAVVRQEMNGARRPSAIDGQSWYGLNSGAKNSVDKNYLAMAEATGRVQVLPLHMVVDIIEASRGVYFVVANEINTNGAIQRTRTFMTRHLFMAAGATHTPALLVKAREKRTMPRLNDSVGRDWGGNGDFVVFRGGLGDNSAGQGGPCGHILMEDTKNRFNPSAMVELVVPKANAFPGASLYIGLALAAPVGFFTYDAATDSAKLTWPGNDPALRPFLAGAEAMVNTLNAANPGSFTAFYGPNLTAHPVGGVVMGKACNHFGRVRGHRGLFIVDGSIIPNGSVGGVNPAYTIAAVAERSMVHIVERLDEED